MTIETILKNHALSHIDVFSGENTDSLEYRAAVMLAAQADGAVVEWTYKINREVWWKLDRWCFNWDHFVFRISPTCRPKPAPRPWSKPEDVPVEAEWFRRNQYSHETGRIVGIYDWGIQTSKGLGWGWPELPSLEWSDRSRQSWKPCTTDKP